VEKSKSTEIVISKFSSFPIIGVSSYLAYILAVSSSLHTGEMRGKIN
jgi:hypothetical protein